MNLNSLPQVCPAGICGALKTLSPLLLPLSLSLSLCLSAPLSMSVVPRSMESSTGWAWSPRLRLRCPSNLQASFVGCWNCPFAQGTGRKSYWKDGKCLPKLLSMSMCMGVHVLSRFINWVNTN